MSSSSQNFRHTLSILGDPGADSGGERKSKRAGKYGMKKRKERWEEPLGKMSYQTSSKLSWSFWLLISARKLLCFSAQSEDRTAATVWNWSGKTSSPFPVLFFKRLFFVPYFPAHLNFLSPPLSAPGSSRMYFISVTQNVYKRPKDWKHICCSYYFFFFSGNFYFSFVSTSLACITMPKNKRRTKITWDKKLTTTCIYSL